MLKHYFKLALRVLLRNRLHLVISLAGLSTGIACCVLVFLFVRQELSFDRFHENADRIYRVTRTEATDELSGGTPSTSALLYQTLLDVFPQVDKATRILANQLVVTYEDKTFNEQVLMVDSQFLSIFSFPMIEGNPERALQNPNSVVLTADAAHKFFGDRDPIGRTVSMLLGETTVEFTVSGVTDNVPDNSSIQYDMLISVEHVKLTTPEAYLTTWNMIFFSTYALVNPGTDIAALEKQMTEHIRSIAQFEETIDFGLQPIAAIHLNATLGGEQIPAGNTSRLYILSAVALAVLIIACINFMTLSIGRSTGRAREVGLRKVMGARRWQLLKQFWGEAFVLSAGAVVVGIALTEAFLPLFNDLAQTHLSLHLFSDWAILPALLILAIITTLLSGTYPAILLSRPYPADIFRGRIPLGGKSGLVQGLVVLQFAISIFLILGTFLISSQMNYIVNANLGYDKEHVITFPIASTGQEAANLLERLRTELSSRDDIVDMTGYTWNFGESWLYVSFDKDNNQTILIGEDLTGPGFSENADDAVTYFYINWVDEHYIPTMGMNLIEGRNFSPDHPSDKGESAIINRAAAEMWELEDPVGHKLPGRMDYVTIIGVIDDFAYFPLHRKIEPLVLRMPTHRNLGSIGSVAVRLKSDNMPGTIGAIRNVWSDVSGGRPFEYSFLDETVGRQYVAEERWRKILQYSSVLSMIITCLGLVGLTSLAVARRTKEIGIRKTLGATVRQVVMMLAGNFFKLIIIANIIAWPAAYLIMDDWLQNFAYRYKIQVWVFIITGLLVMIIAMITISFQAVRAATANPVDAIRHE